MDDAVQDEPMEISTDDPSGEQENRMVLEDDPGPIVSPSVRLQYLCTKSSLPRPSYILVDEKGPSHLKSFTSVCIVGEMVEEGSGPSKSRSRSQASENMILRIKQLSNNEENETVESFENTSGNIHISVLHNYCSANFLHQPCFIFIREDGPLHRRIYTYDCKVGNIVAQASGYSKADAKHRAAEMVLKKLKFSVSNNSNDQSKNSMNFEAFLERVLENMN